METTDSIRQLIDDATRRGLNVTETADRVVIRRGKTNRSVGLAIWPNDTATRTDVDLTIATRIDSVREMRRVLNVPAQNLRRKPRPPKQADRTARAFGFTPREESYSIALEWLRLAYDQTTDDIDEEHSGPLGRRSATRRQVAKLHNRLLQQSGMEGIELSTDLDEIKGSDKYQ